MPFLQVHLLLLDKWQISEFLLLALKRNQTMKVERIVSSLSYHYILSHHIGLHEVMWYAQKKLTR